MYSGGGGVSITLPRDQFIMYACTSLTRLFPLLEANLAKSPAEKSDADEEKAFFTKLREMLAARHATPLVVTAKADGGAFDLKRHLGICRLWLRPMEAVGERARLMKSASGCQNQKWVKTAIPTIAPIILCPDLERREMVMLRPPASRIPVARIAPNLASVSSCLSATTFCRW